MTAALIYMSRKVHDAHSQLDDAPYTDDVAALWRHVVAVAAAAVAPTYPDECWLNDVVALHTWTQHH